MFWISENLQCGNISIKINEELKSISSYPASGNAPDCGTPGYATFALSPGEYAFTASCLETTWNGTVVVTEGSCSKMRLVKSNTGEIPGSEGKGGLSIMFDINRATTRGAKRLISANISVTVEGIKRGTITSPYSLSLLIPYSSPGDCSHNASNNTTVFYTGDAGKQVTYTWAGTLEWEFTSGEKKTEYVDITQRVTIEKGICKNLY